MKPTLANVTFTWECLPEDAEIEGNASAIDSETDKEIANEIRRQLNAGNEWAWCTIKCTATIQGTRFQGVDYLGCCSYKSFEDFVEADDYFKDMKSQALADLETDILNAEKDLAKVRAS